MPDLTTKCQAFRDKNRSQNQPQSCFAQKVIVHDSHVHRFLRSQQIDAKKKERLLNYALTILEKSRGDANKWHFHSLATLAEFHGMTRSKYAELDKWFVENDWLAKKVDFVRGEKCVSSWRRLGARWDFLRGSCDAFKCFKSLYENDGASSLASPLHGDYPSPLHGDSNPKNYKSKKFKSENNDDEEKRSQKDTSSSSEDIDVPLVKNWRAQSLTDLAVRFERFYKKGLKGGYRWKAANRAAIDLRSLKGDSLDQFEKWLIDQNLDGRIYVSEKMWVELLKSFRESQKPRKIEPIKYVEMTDTEEIDEFIISFHDPTPF